MSKLFWFGSPEADSIFCSARTAAGIRWARARAERVIGPYDSADQAVAAVHDARGVCRVCSRGQGRHVCAECQAAILPAALVASVASVGAR